MPLQDFWFQEYSVQVTFREQWNDERLRYVDSTKGKKSYMHTRQSRYVQLSVCSYYALKWLKDKDRELWTTLDWVDKRKGIATPRAPVGAEK